MSLVTETNQADDALCRRAAEIFRQRCRQMRRRADRALATLLIFQFFVFAAACVFARSDANLLERAAHTILAAALLLVPALLARRGRARHSNAFAVVAGQMLAANAALCIFGWRLETYFYFFAALIFASLYRNARVLIVAAAIAVAACLASALLFSAARSGDQPFENLLWLKLIACILGESALLLALCRRRLDEMQFAAANMARFEAQQENYRSLIEKADDIIYRTDAAGYFTFINPNFARVLGVAPLAARQIIYTEVIAPAHRRAAAKFYSKQFAERAANTYYELPIVGADGNDVWIGQNVQLVFQNDRIVGFQAVARDITKRIAVEQALRESEERYRIVTDSASDAIITIDENSRILFANRAAETIFGFTNAELIGEKLQIIAPERLRAAHAAGMQRYLQSGKRKLDWRSVEVLAQRKNGDEFPIEISFGEYDVAGKRIFTAVVRDIGERKRAAEAVKKSEEYRNLFRLANDAIMILEPLTEIVLDVNDCACEMYGFARDEFVGRSLKDMSENVERGEDYLSLLLDKGIYNEFESTQFRADGTPLNLLINASLIEFNGQTAILSINRDVTESKQREAALRESEYRFRTLLESMNEGLLHVDNADRVQYANEHFCQMVGYTPDELLNRVWTELLLRPEERETIKQVNERRLSGIADGYELRLIKKTGETICALVGGAPVYNADNLIVGSMGVFTDITDRKRAEEQLLHNALHDALTGLPNRALFLEHLRHTIDRNQRRFDAAFAVLFLDFDRFKVINDSLGHMEGDKLLVAIARRLEKCVRASDIVARLGGDEFTILVGELDDYNEVTEIVERIQTDLKQPFDIGGREIFISASIGIALNNHKYRQPEEMLRDADAAMYEAKAAGKARYEVFNPAMHQAANERLQLETELRHALERGEFCNHYQPIIELATNRVVGFESLVRWQHPTRGLVAPGEFIAAMEETGLIVGLGLWVLRESCEQLRQWQTMRRVDCPNLTMSVNLSCKQFLQFDLAERVGEILRETRIKPECLRLEITESHVMEDSELAISIMHRLRALGVKLSIDDFGTGYSSLSYLHRLPINYLKIDRSFVSRMLDNHENAEIVRTIVALAKNLELDVIAEGIELVDQAEQLRRLECRFGQGFLFSKPLDAAKAACLIETESAVNPLVVTDLNINLIEFVN